MSEKEEAQSFSSKTGGAFGFRGILNNAFDKLKGVKVPLTSEAADTSLGAMQAQKPPVTKKIEKDVADAQKPSARDLFAGYAGKANTDKYEKKIAELMKDGVPLQDDISKLFPDTDTANEIYNAVDANYPAWSEKINAAILAEKRKGGGTEKRDVLPEKELHRKYDDFVGKFLYVNPQSEGYWIKVEGDLKTSKFRIISSAKELNQKEIGWREFDKLLKEYKFSDKKHSNKKPEAPVPEIKPEGGQEKTKLTREGVLTSVESKKNGTIRVIQGGPRLTLTPHAFDKLLDKLIIRIPQSQEKDFANLSVEDKNDVLESMDGANEEIEEALRAQSGHVIKAKEETLEEKEEKNKKEQADREMSRNATMFTLAKINNVEELWAKNEKEGNEKFAKKTRELWKEFAVHGRFAVDGKGNPTSIVDTDLDGEVSLGLLKRAGFNTKDVKCVNPGDFEEGRLMLDSGGRDGVSFEMNADNLATLFFDHHGEKSENDASAAAITYKTLIGMGLLEKDSVLDKVVEFVTQVDNWKFPQQELFFDRSNKTVLGLYRWIKFDKLVEFAKGKKKFTDLLSQQELKDLGLEDRSRKQGWTVENAKKKFDELEKNGQVFHSSKYGRVVVSMDKELRGRYDAARYFGCDTFLEWNPKTQGFAIYSDKVIGDDFGEGVRVREKMWMRPPKEGQSLNISLGEILQKIGGDDFHPTGELAKYLEEEKKAIEDRSRVVIPEDIKDFSDFKSDYEKEVENLDKLPSMPPSLEPMEDAVRRAQVRAGEDIARIEKEEKEEKEAKERLMVEFYEGFGRKFWLLLQKKAMAEFEKWGYNEKDRKRLLENQTRKYLKIRMSEKNDFSGEQEEKINQIMEVVKISV